MSENTTIGQLDVVVGGQFGSEAKGHVTAQIAARRINSGYPVTAVRVAGPNAGHSAVGHIDGVKYALRQIPVAAVVDNSIQLVLGAGSEIDESVLEYEVDLLDQAGYEVSERLVIDGQATVLEESHKQAEAGSDYNHRFGSTAKGIGQARMARLDRSAAIWDFDGGNDTATLLNERLALNECVIVEGTQGYGLGLHAGFYPYCTSSDCRAIDFLAMAGISPWRRDLGLDVWVVARTFPIRVAGNSGPLRGEVDWNHMQEYTDGYIQGPELTTVTQKPRRIGQWDSVLVKKAMIANGAPSAHTHLVVTFLDYIDPTMADGEGKLTERAAKFLQAVEADCGVTVDGYTTGANSIAWRLK
jgi:adenylosuccinate synthase